MYQPIRGFGKVWRENEDIWNGLGWALAPEQGFDTQWQPQMRESLPATAFVRTLDEEIVKISSWGWQSGGRWQIVIPKARAPNGVSAVAVAGDYV